MPENPECFKKTVKNSFIKRQIVVAKLLYSLPHLYRFIKLFL